VIDPKINVRSKSAISAQVNNNAGIALAWLNLVFPVERQLFPHVSAATAPRHSIPPVTRPPTTDTVFSAPY
jgi:hypothetical protein